MGVSNFDEEARDPRRRTAKKLLQSLDEVLAVSKQEYADLWRITCLERGSNHTFATSCEIVSALVKAKKQGKARFIGISSHDKRWLKFMIDYFPQIEVILTPYTALTKALQKDSLFESAVKNDVGILGIKPFAANSLFKGNSTPNNPHAEEDDKLAMLTIRYILGNPAVTAPIPGLISAHQVDNVAKAVKERRDLDLAEARELEQAIHQAWANLPARYQWLKHWEYV
jgi:aryl-alcohol dehydrogenase-like predicted oxidoreductase